MFLSLEDITLQVGGRRVFENTTWHIQRGQHWVILGASGSGKSTLGKALARRVPLAGGHIHYFFDGPSAPEGRPYLLPNEVLTLSAETHRAYLRRFAAYHQARWQSLEGEEAPSVGALLTEAARQAESAHPAQNTAALSLPQVTALFELEPLLGRKIVHLSHGESRKAFFARLLLLAPRLLILDDPLTGLDAETRPRLAQAIAELLHRASPQVVYITSHAEEIPAEIEHLLLVRHCRVVAAGSRDSILTRPEAKSFLQDPGRPLGSPAAPTPAFQKAVEQYASALAGDPGAQIPVFIDLQHVCVTYGRAQILRDVTWSVRRGERWALCGRNGAGKSTLLSLVLADNPQAYANQVSLFGVRRGSGESIWQIKQRIGWVAPELHIYYPEGVSARAVVASGFFDSAGLYQTVTPAQAQQVALWMEGLSIAGLAPRPFHELSSGQQRQCLLARALVKNPPLLILDEPCQGLDPSQTRAFLELIDRLCAAAPLTLVYVSHAAAEIPACITHRLRLEKGRLVE